MGSEVSCSGSRCSGLVAAARAYGVAVMGIRAVQAGALTGAIDRPLPSDHPEMSDYARAAGFRALAAELEEVTAETTEAVVPAVEESAFWGTGGARDFDWGDS